MPSIIQSLVLEHRNFCVLFEQMQAALPRLELIEVKMVTRHLEQLLLGHAAAEDDLVLLALHEAPEYKRRYERFHKEHQEIDGQLIQIYGVEDRVTAEPFFKALIAHSRRHFIHEEKVIFPLLEQVMGAEVLIKLGTVWGLRRQASKGVMSELFKKLDCAVSQDFVGAKEKRLQALWLD